MRAIARAGPWAAVMLAVVFALRAATAARAKSAVIDEPFYIGAGAALAKTGDFRLKAEKPLLSPLLLGLPQLWTGADFSRDDPDWLKSDPAYAGPREGPYPEANFGLRFLYANKVPADKILFWSRMVPLLVSLLLAWLVYGAGCRLYGPSAGLCSLALFTLCPNILAHSGLATEDMIFTASYFAACHALSLFLESPTPARGSWLGLASAAALTSKYTGVILLPVFAVLSLRGGAWRPLWWKDRWKGLAAAAACLGAAMLALYGRQIGRYLSDFEHLARYMNEGQATFFAGKYSFRGFWYYFPALFLIKTPLPLLLLVLPPLLTPKRYLESRHLRLAVPVLALMGAACSSPFQIGHRHILPIYPFLFVLAGQAAASLRWRKALWVLLPWSALESFSVQPHYLAYFNELAGGPSKGWHYAVDSNIDSGQDLKGLREYVSKTGASDVILSYFGSGTPESVGFPFQDLYSFGVWGRKDRLNGEEPRRELLAVSVTNLQGVYLYYQFGGNPLAWVKDMAPEARIGNTLHVYDVTRDARGHEWLAHTYLIAGHPAFARREALRALRIDPRSAWALLVSSFLAPRKEEGLRLFESAVRADPGLALPWDRLLATERARRWYGRGLARTGEELLGRRKADLALLAARLCAQADPAAAPGLESRALALLRRQR